jgi:pSer/pThr/pTyr-binding forkhead associated (FHA) protein
MKQVTIGRDLDSTIVVDQSHGRVSNEHASIELQDGQLIFIDHSTNGSTVNGRPIHNSSIAVKNGDIISLADSYVLPWTTILSNFPELQRKTERFDGSQISIEDENRRTELISSVREEGATVPFNESRKNSGGENVTIGQLSDYTQAEIEETLEKFNWGAFLSTWMWAIGQKLYWPLVIIPISFIPYIGQICSLFLCTYLGITGYKTAWKNYSGESFSRFLSKQRKWKMIGLVLFPVFTLIQFISLYLILLEI